MAACMTYLTPTAKCMLTKVLPCACLHVHMHALKFIFAKCLLSWLCKKLGIILYSSTVHKRRDICYHRNQNYKAMQWKHRQDKANIAKPRCTLNKCGHQINEILVLLCHVNTLLYISRLNIVRIYGTA